MVIYRASLSPTGEDISRSHTHIFPEDYSHTHIILGDCVELVGDLTSKKIIIMKSCFAKKIITIESCFCYISKIIVTVEGCFAIFTFRKPIANNNHFSCIHTDKMRLNHLQ